MCGPRGRGSRQKGLWTQPLLQIKEYVSDFIFLVKLNLKLLLSPAKNMLLLKLKFSKLCRRMQSFLALAEHSLGR